MCAVSPEKCVEDVPSTTTAPTTSQNAIKYVPKEQCEIKDHTLNNEEQSFIEVHKGFTKKPILYAKNPPKLDRMFPIKTEKIPLFRTNKAMLKYIMQSHTLRQNRRLRSHQHQIHVSFKSTIPYAQRSVV